MQELLQPLPAPGDIKTLKDGRRLMSRPKVCGLGELESIILPPAGEASGRMQVWGEAHITNGAGECRVPGCGCDQMHIVARNKIVGQGLATIFNRLLSFQNVSSNNTISWPSVFETNQLTRSYIRVGTGSGATSDATTTLASQVATNPTGTAFTISNPSTGVYRHHFSATWTAGAITGATVTEIGVFGNLMFPLNTALTVQANGAGSTSLAMFSRLSVTDSEFSSFVIDTGKPLVIEYRLTFTFT